MDTFARLFARFLAFVIRRGPSRYGSSLTNSCVESLLVIE